MTAEVKYVRPRLPRYFPPGYFDLMFCTALGVTLVPHRGASLYRRTAAMRTSRQRTGHCLMQIA